MKVRSVVLNILLNLLLTVVFIWLNQWALRNHFEETFVASELVYGCTITIGNALFVLAAKPV